LPILLIEANARAKYRWGRDPLISA
jgi:hypothetical protein